MPWTLDRYTPAMSRLDPLVRAKAIEIANALLESGHGEGQAVRMGIASAQRRVLRDGRDIDDERSEAGPSRPWPRLIGRDRGWEI